MGVCALLQAAYDLQAVSLSLRHLDGNCHAKLGYNTYDCREIAGDPAKEAESNVNDVFGSSKMSGFGIDVVLWGICI